MNSTITDSPLRNRTTLQQERQAFAVIHQLVRGQDVQPGHLLRKVNTGLSWNTPLQKEFGLWETTVKQTYCAFLRRGAPGARMTILILSITDESLCALIRRYAQPGEREAVFGFPKRWHGCACYTHRWCS